MSSHHFVKEGQEPALVLLDALTFDTAGPLLEWAPLVMVAERAIEDVILWNIKIDVVLAEEKNVQELSSRLVDQAPLTILAYTSNESPLVNALYYLIRTKQNGVSIFSSNVDETIALAEKFADQLQICVVDGTFKWSGVAVGHFEKWMAAKTPIFLRKSRMQQSMDLVGLKETGDHYESVVDGMIRLRSETLFWVGEPYLSEV
ncbi:MAG TPA: hypothetical protein VK589_22230 [Chryseolinea sp.]|nr:hypothetical protein [Chryseolinea sp.]